MSLSDTARDQLTARIADYLGQLPADDPPPKVDTVYSQLYPDQVDLFEFRREFNRQLVARPPVVDLPPQPKSSTPVADKKPIDDLAPPE